MVPKLREDRPGRGGDHESFIRAGIAGVRFIDTNENLVHQHSPDDQFAFLTPAYTARLARLVVAMAASLARAPTPPQSPSAALGSGNTVNVAWQPPASGPAVDHYVVSARLASEHFYRTRFVLPGTASGALARISDDLGIPEASDFFISVAAVDTAGHESLYAYPEYRCGTDGCVIPPFAFDITSTR